MLSLGLALGGCSPEGAAESSGQADADPAVSARTAPSPETTVFPGNAVESSLAASSTFYTSSPAAVVLSVDDPAAAALAPEAAAAAAAAAGLGVPLLVAGPGDGVRTREELDRLGSTAVVAYGHPGAGWPDLAGDRTLVSGPLEADAFDPALGIDASPVAPLPPEALVQEVAALERNGVLNVPEAAAAEPTGVQTPEAGTAAAAEEGTAAPEGTAGELPEFTPASEPAGAVVLATGDPASFAAVATSRAAGATVRVVGSADPRTDPETIELLRSRSGDSLYAVGNAFGAAQDFAAQAAVARQAPELPGGGQTVFPGRRMVALYGHPSGPSLGALGEQGIDESIQRVQDLAAQYQPFSDEPVVPALEIITTVASAEPGPDGDYSTETAPEELLPWIDAAEKAGVYVVLDLQPGTSHFLDQARRYESLLKRPYVGLALDAEWRLSPGQRHLEQIGSVDAAEINEVSAWLAGLTRDNVLPQKVFMLHQFNLSMINNRDLVATGAPELAFSLHADGHGTPGEKLDTWNVLRQDLDPGIYPGWKNFYDEDTPMLTPEQTFALTPKPWFISYQ